MITAKTDPGKGTRGISSFIIEKGTPGFQLGRNEKKMGLKGSVTSELFFENCRIPAENLLGRENEGFKQFLTTLDAGRLAISAMAVGLAGGLRESRGLCQRAGAVRPADRPIPGDPVDDRGHGHGHRSRPADGPPGGLA